MANWTITFTTDSNETARVIIYGMSSAKTLTPASNPFTTCGNNDNDFFCPVRDGSGYLRILCNMGDADELMTSPKKLSLYVGNEAKWWGFTKCEAYTQPFEGGLIEMEIPLVDTLGQLKNIFMPKTWNYLTSLRELIYHIFNQLEDCVYQAAYPERTDYETILCHMIDCSNWIDNLDEPNADGDYINTKSLYDIVTDICIAYGWSVVQNGYMWIFLSRDCDSSDSTYALIDMEEGDFIRNIALSQFTSISLNGTEHSITYNSAKKSVNVSNNPGDVVEELYTFNINDLGYITKGNVTDTKILVSEYYHGQQHDVLNSVKSTSSQKGLILEKLQAYKAGANKLSNSPYGMCIESIDYHLQNEEEKRLSFNSGISICPTNGNLPPTALTISPRIRVSSENQGKLYLVIAGNINVIYDFDKGVEEIENTISLVARLKYGNLYYTSSSVWDNVSNSFYLNFKSDGRIYDNSNSTKTVPFPLQKYVNACSILLPVDINGKIELEIKIPTASNQYEALILSGLQISLFRLVPMFTKDTQGKANEETKQLSTKNGDDYSIGGNLTCHRNNQTGPGVILGEKIDDPDGTWSYPFITSLDNTNLTPEKSLLNRLVAYYSTPYRVIELGMKGNTPSPFQSINLQLADENVDFVPICINRDWKTGNSTVTLIEKK